MNRTTFSGNFGDDVIDINGTNTLGGTDNVFNGAFGGNFCETVAGQTGFFGFPGGPSNCPP